MGGKKNCTVETQKALASKATNVREAAEAVSCAPGGTAHKLQRNAVPSYSDALPTSVSSQLHSTDSPAGSSPSYSSAWSQRQTCSQRSQAISTSSLHRLERVEGGVRKLVAV